jgi:hypothetical protein
MNNKNPIPNPLKGEREKEKEESAAYINKISSKAND